MQLPENLRDVQVMGPVGSLVKFHYGDPKVHYEVWVWRRAGAIEVGLHFEGAPEVNLAYLDELKGRYSGAVASLGPEVELEQWTNSWTRVHRTFQFSVLDEDLLMEISGFLSRMVDALQPAVTEISAGSQYGL